MYHDAMLTFCFSVVAILVFAFFDYVGFNNMMSVKLFRISQYLLYGFIVILLYQGFGIWSSISFAILHITFCSDILYYYFYDGLRWYGGAGAGKLYVSEVIGNKVTWAYWTPYGIVTRWIPGKKNVPINGNILIEQAAFGFLLTILIGIVVSNF